MAFISGASRGIGLALVERLLVTTASSVVASGRSVAASVELQALKAAHGERLTVLPMDVGDEESVAAAVGALPAGLEKLELVAHCAAMMHPSGRGETSIARMGPDKKGGAAMAATLAVNVVGPSVLTAALWPRLRRKKSELDAGLRPGAVVAVGAGVGSISTNKAGGWYSYRVSKTALQVRTMLVLLLMPLLLVLLRLLLRLLVLTPLPEALMMNLSIEGARAGVVAYTLYTEGSLLLL